MTGKSQEDAGIWAEDNDMFIRVVAEDGEQFTVTEDYSPNRLNVEVADGIVTAVVSVG